MRNEVMKRIWLLGAIIMTLMMAGCNKDDDLGNIFNGKFKITSYRYNGTYEMEKLKEMNKNMNVYCITFSGNTFTGELNAGRFISGKWSADASNRDFKMEMDEAIPTPTELSRMIVNIMKNASGYSGDHNVVRIYSDDKNYIDLDSGQF